MKYEHTREYLLPVMVELTYEDLQLIQRMAKVLLDMEKLPDEHGHMYKGDVRRLEREAREAINKVADTMKLSYTFQKIDEPTSNS
jgi:hypothetical protein